MIRVYWRSVGCVLVGLLLCSHQEVRAQGLFDSLEESAAGMRVEGERMKVITQNIANVDSAGKTPGAEPYRRKTITFKNKLNKVTGVTVVTVDKIGQDRKSDFNKRYDPSHPGANAEGYVLYPNVNTPIELMDMHEAENSYQANLGAIETSKSMYLKTLDLLH
jgi:flagellar basal-body rod protein FlgC